MTTEVWTELAKIGILRDTPDGSPEIQFAGMVEDVTAFDYGEKDIEGVPLLSGGRVVKRVPMTDESITLKVVPVTVTPQEGIQPYLAGTADTSDPYSVLLENARQKHRVVILWATTLPATASEIPKVGGNTVEARRITIANAYCTKAAPSFDDKYMSGEIIFKWAPFKKDGTSNRKEEYGGTATGLAAVTATATDVTN